MPAESFADRKERASKIARILEKTYPDARTELNYKNPLELLVATILSAQCTDERVNRVTDTLFRRYRTAADYAAADPEEFQEEIRPTGFYRNKTKAVLGMATALVENFDGEVPDSIDDLVTLPGVARKTANVVLGNAFGKNEGIVVDTHVIRVSGRLELTAHKDNTGDKIEKDLMELIPRKKWTRFGDTLILHGRRTCTARNPKCGECPVNGLCPSAFKF